MAKRRNAGGIASDPSWPVIARLTFQRSKTLWVCIRGHAAAFPEHRAWCCSPVLRAKSSQGRRERSKIAPSMPLTHRRLVLHWSILWHVIGACSRTFSFAYVNSPRQHPELILATNHAEPHVMAGPLPEHEEPCLPRRRNRPNILQNHYLCSISERPGVEEGISKREPRQ